jgi:hypothetical protein
MKLTNLITLLACAAAMFVFALAGPAVETYKAQLTAHLEQAQ